MERQMIEGKNKGKSHMTKGSGVGCSFFLGGGTATAMAIHNSNDRVPTWLGTQGPGGIKENRLGKSLEFASQRQKSGPPRSIWPFRNHQRTPHSFRGRFFQYRGDEGPRGVKVGWNNTAGADGYAAKMSARGLKPKK